MKKVVIIVLSMTLIFAIYLSGCTEEKEIIGTWDLQIPDNELDDQYDYSFTYTFYENMSLKVSYYLDFLGSEPISEWGNYTLDGDQLCIFESQGSVTCATYEILDDGNTLRLIDPDNPDEEPVTFTRVS